MKHIKPPYYDYALYMWRCYVRYRDGLPADASRVMIENWGICDELLNALTDEERDTLLRLSHSEPKTEKLIIRDYAVQNRIAEAHAWNVIRRCLRRTAVERGIWEMP